MDSNQNLEENASEECRLQQTPISERLPAGWNARSENEWLSGWHTKPV